MAASNVAVIYDVASVTVRRLIVPDDDSQITALDGPCALQTGEAVLLIAMATYQPGMTAAQIQALVAAAAITAIPAP